MEIIIAAVFYIACAATVILTVYQTRKATRLKRILASVVLFIAGAVAFICQRNFIHFGYFILGGLLFSLAGVSLLGARKSRILRGIGAVIFIFVNVFYFIAFENNLSSEFAVSPYNVFFFVALVVFMAFGGLVFFMGKKQFTPVNLLLLPNIIITAAAAALGVSLGIRYLNAASYSITLGLLLVFGCSLFAFANFAVCLTFKNKGQDLNSKTGFLEKFAVPAYYIGQLMLLSSMLFVRIGRQ